MEKLLLFLIANLVVFTLSAEPFQNSSSGINDPATLAYGTSMPKQSFTISNADIQKINGTKIESFKTLLVDTVAMICLLTRLRQSARPSRYWRAAW